MPSPVPLLSLSDPSPLLPFSFSSPFSLSLYPHRWSGCKERHCHAGTEEKKKERHHNGWRKELSGLISEIRKGHRTSGTTLPRLGPIASFDLPCKQKGVWWCDAMAWKSSLPSLHIVPHFQKSHGPSQTCRGAVERKTSDAQNKEEASLSGCIVAANQKEALKRKTRIGSWMGQQPTRPLRLECAGQPLASHWWTGEGRRDHTATLLGVDDFILC